MNKLILVTVLGVLGTSAFANNTFTQGRFVGTCKNTETYISEGRINQKNTETVYELNLKIADNSVTINNETFDLLDEVINGEQKILRQLKTIGQTKSKVEISEDRLVIFLSKISDSGVNSTKFALVEDFTSREVKIVKVYTNSSVFNETSMNNGECTLKRVEPVLTKF